MTIRRGTRADLPQIEKIQQAAEELPQWQPEAYLGYDLLVAEYQGQVVGFVVSRKTASDEHEVLNVAVAPEHRRQRVAARMLRTLMEGTAGAFYLEVRESNHAARSLYAAIGFEETGRRPQYYQNPDEAAIVMRKQSC